MASVKLSKSIFDLFKKENKRIQSNLTNPNRKEMELVFKLRSGDTSSEVPFFLECAFGRGVERVFANEIAKEVDPLVIKALAEELIKSFDFKAAIMEQMKNKMQHYIERL